MRLQRGDRGEKVMVLQAALMGVGAQLPQYGVDGIFGAETEAAVRHAQQMYNLPVTGVADAELLQIMGAGDQIFSTGSSTTSSAGPGNWILLGLTV